MKNNLLKKYQQLNMPHKFLVTEVDNILKKKYKAVEVPVNEFIEFKKDPFVDYSTFVKSYFIQNEEILNSLYSEKEKADIDRMRECIQEMRAAGELLLPQPSDEDYDLQVRYTNFAEGRLIAVILESIDRQYVSGFQMQGAMCEKLYHELKVFKGIDPADCVEGNPILDEYLEALVKAGYL
ncbi:hypothetical protein ABEV15_08740 [Bhargavaea massiliensis]